MLLKPFVFLLRPLFFQKLLKKMRKNKSFYKARNFQAILKAIYSFLLRPFCSEAPKEDVEKQQLL